MKVYIKAMAVTTQDAKQQLISAGGEAIEHLIKLYAFPDTEYTNHWRQEVWSFLRKVPKLKSTKRYVDFALIRDCLSAYEDMIPELYSEIVNEYKSLTPARFDMEELQRIIGEYFDWIAQILSEKGLVCPEDVYAILDKLGL